MASVKLAADVLKVYTGSGDEFLEDCEILKLLSRRGPDSKCELHKKLNEEVALWFCGCVLHQQGDVITKQPHADEFGNILLWNGEIYDSQKSSKSDTEILAKKLMLEGKDRNICHVLNEVNGEWAIIYWHEESKKLWFGRDVMGRRSLVWAIRMDENSNISLTLSSVGSPSCPCESHGTEFSEFPADGLYAIDCGNTLQNSSSKLSVEWHPWIRRDLPCGLDCCDFVDVMHHPALSNSILLNRDDVQSNVNVSIDESIECLFETLCNDETFCVHIEELRRVLGGAVAARTLHRRPVCRDCYLSTKNLSCSHSSLAVLFSGGLDSAVIAALADRCVEEDVPIDLINVAFKQTVGIYNDKKGKNVQTNSEDCAPEDDFNVPDRISGKEALEELNIINPNRVWNFIEVNVTKEELVKMRESHIAQLVYPRTSVLDDSIGCAIWFAARGEGSLLHADGSRSRYRSPSKVVLVGMGADEQLAGYSRHREVFRKAGLSGLFDEIQMEVDRIWSRNLGRDDRVISDHGREARFPFLDRDVMTFLSSLPMSYKGALISYPTANPTGSSTVAHATSWILNCDLGSYVTKGLLDYRDPLLNGGANLSLPRGIGEKLVLRLLAFKMGLRKTATLAKRAIQFGSRIAKLENRKEKASDSCQRLNVSFESKTNALR